ncbi:MAG: chorismate-binding protein [Marmoricola sp.]
MNVPEIAFVLHLPNVMHLVSTGVVDPGGSKSPRTRCGSAPIGCRRGTPTKTAVDLIDQIEAWTEGRYAGPVGWFDANGDGESASPYARLTCQVTRRGYSPAAASSPTLTPRLSWRSLKKLVPVRDA